MHVAAACLHVYCCRRKTYLAPHLSQSTLPQSRNVDTEHPTQPFPAALQAILHRLHAVPDMPQVGCVLLMKRLRSLL